MGDKSPKDKNKKQKQHEKQVQDLNKAREAKQNRNQPGGGAPNDAGKKAS